MATKLMKPNMYRQVFLSTSAKRTFTSQPTLTRSFGNHTSNTSSFLRRSNAFKQQTPIVSSPQARIAAFHSSSKKEILPAGPQVIQGTTNDPAPVHKPEPIHGSYHWTFERLVAVGIIPLTFAPFIAGTLNPTLDAVFVATMLIHSHIGFQSCVIDYFPKNNYAGLRKLMEWTLRIATLAAAVGFYEFETHDVGVTEAVKRIWHA